jgi:hypothetical protein
MFSKMIALSCLASVALAQTEVASLVKSQSTTAKGIKELGASLRSTAKEIGDVVDADNFRENMETVDGLVMQQAGLQGTLNGIGGGFDRAIASNHKQLTRDIAQANDHLDAELEAALDEITAALSTAQEDVDTNIMGLLDEARVDNVELKDTTDALIARLDAHKVCNVKGQVYNPDGDADDKCELMTFSASQSMTKVNHRMMNNNDDRDSGYVNNRYITFTKTQDDTYIRVFYHDNFRVHGHGSWASWNVMICDSNGNGCDYCRTPGRLRYWRYAYHQGQWWMNDHWSGSVAGVCKTANNRDIRKGQYQLRTMINDNRYDIYTGHNQHNSFMVDEVFKY